VSAALPVDSNTLLGLLVPEDTGSTIFPNFDIGVFTKLQWVTFEKSHEAIKDNVCTCWRQTDVTGPNFQRPIHKSLPLNPVLREMNPFVKLHIFIAMFSQVYVLSHVCYMPCPHP